MCGNSSTTATCGCRRENRVGVHFFEARAAVLDDLSRNGLQSFAQRDRFLPAVRLEVADDDVDATALQLVGLRQHLVGLADTRGVAEEDLQPAARPARWRRSLRKHANVDAFGIANQPVERRAAETGRASCGGGCARRRSA